MDTYPGYDWYVRMFDDTYVFPGRLERLVSALDPAEGVIVGRMGRHGGQKFVGGGAPWDALDRAGRGDPLVLAGSERVHALSEQADILQEYLKS